MSKRVQISTEAAGQRGARGNTVNTALIGCIVGDEMERLQNENQAQLRYETVQYGGSFSFHFAESAAGGDESTEAASVRIDYLPKKSRRKASFVDNVSLATDADVVDATLKHWHAEEQGNGDLLQLAQHPALFWSLVHVCQRQLAAESDADVGGDGGNADKLLGAAIAKRLADCNPAATANGNGGDSSGRRSSRRARG